MPFVPPPPPPNFKKTEYNTEKQTIGTEDKRDTSEKGRKILFSALAVLCFVVAIVMFTLMTVL